MTGPPSFWTVEEACRNAYPAREILLDNWLLRAAGGRSRRTNSVNPIHFAAGDLTEVVTLAETIYARLGQPAIFRVPAFVGGMDAALDRFGYATAGETLTLWADATVSAGSPDGVLLRPAPDASWYDAWAHLNPAASIADGAAFRASVESVILPARYAVRVVDGAPVALAYGVLDRGVLVIEAVVSEARHRRQGHARAVLAALGHWARSAGATGTCLQVAADNESALALYRSLGFDRLLYRYHYRLKA